MKTSFLTENEKFELNSLFDKIEKLNSEILGEEEVGKLWDDIYTHSRRLRSTINLEFDPIEKVKNYDLMGEVRKLFGK